LSAEMPDRISMGPCWRWDRYRPSCWMNEDSPRLPSALTESRRYCQCRNWRRRGSCPSYYREMLGHLLHETMLRT
jgi:hypothetical protein